MTLPTELAPELKNYERQYREAKGEAAELTKELTPDQLVWRPDPTRWSIAECLDHLTTTADQYVPAMDEAIRDGRERGLTGTPPFKRGLVMTMITRWMEPPPRFRMKAPRSFLPPADPTASGQCVPRFQASQDAIVERIRQADGLDLWRIKVVSPVTRWLRMSAGQAFEFLAAHQRRHLWQARQVRNSRSFPRG